MQRNLNVHLRWLTALAVLPACGDDDGAIATASDTDTDTDTDDSSSSDAATITLTTADTSAGPTTTDSSSTGPVAGCGNEVIEDGEVCDGADLGDATCESEGFGAGTLLCAPDCGGFDTTECAAATECGNGIIEDGEDCDGAELGDETCVSQDFDAGDLACADDCTFDITACVNFSCGDGEINGKEECDGDALPKAAECGDFGTGTVGCTNNCVLDYSNCCGDGSVGSEEVCDGDDLGGASCGIVGEFDAGTLSCASACTEFDTSDCTLCGDGVAQGAEVCDGDDLLGADCTTVPGGFVGGTLTCDGACGIDTSGCNFCGNGDIDDGESCDGDNLGDATCLSLGFTGGTLGCTACGLDEGGCTDFPLPGATELVITEIMQNPDALPDDEGEYFELHNPSLVESFQLQGCVVEGGAVDESFVIAADLAIDAGDYLTFAFAADPGFTPDYVWSGFSLNNVTDTLRVVCDGVTVDEVAYDDGATFPDPTGASMQLEPTSTDSVSNDVGGNWCESGVPFGSGDLGTPGSANTSCLPPVFTVDFCRLQFPTAVSELEGTAVDVFGRLFIGGLTDLSGTNDPEPNVLMQVGHGPDGSDPAVSVDWVWETGAPNDEYGALSPGYEPNNDEYLATMTVPDPGESDFAVRFTGDGGLSYTYCDGGGAGSSNGYAPADAGQMTSLPQGDPAALYFSEYYEGTAFNKILEIYNPGVDPVNLADCTVLSYVNGSAVPSPLGGIPLTGIVGGGDAHVLCDDVLEAFAFCDQLAESLTFNGDDAIELRCDGATNDVIGQIGVDPGTAWTGGNPVLSTLNFVLRRNCDVTQGDADGSDAFDPSIQWTGLPINSLNAQPENTGDLGLYVCID